MPGQKSKKASIQGKSRIFVWREMYKAALPLGPAKVTFWQEWIKAQIPRAVFTSANADALILSLFGKAFKYNLKSGILLYQAYSLLWEREVPLDASSGHQCNGPYSLTLEKPQGTCLIKLKQSNTSFQVTGAFLLLFLTLLPNDVDRFPLLQLLPYLPDCILKAESTHKSVRK